MKADAVATTETVHPYPPSWLDRLTAWVERLKLPAPAFYALAGVVAIALFILNEAVNGLELVDATRPFHIVLAIGPIYAVALVHFLDTEAGRALEKIKPLMTCDEIGYAALRYQLTTTPARGALWAGLVGMSAGLAAVGVERAAMPRAFASFILPGAGRAFIEIWLVSTWFIFGGLFFHTVHQLRLMSRIYTHDTRIDLDQYRPLFNFSRVSALTAIGLLLLPYGWYATVPGLIQEPIGIVFGALFPVFAVVAFVAPLVGVHHLLVDAKEHALVENAHALKAARAELYHRAAAGELTAASAVHDMLAAVRSERTALEHLHTWPWQSDTLRSVVAVLVLPLVLWFIQWLLGRLLAP
jgi:hypothetical protein